jgi:hypothetical protein
MSTRNSDVGRGLLYIFSDAADTYMPLVLDLSPEVTYTFLPWAFL